jgi:hypothetical protein
VNVPGFLVKRFYVEGSLRNSDSGFSLQARNALGDGALVGVGRLAVDGREIEPSSVSAVRDADGERFRAADVSPARPIHVRVGDSVTLHVEGEPLEAGVHKLEVELYELNLGFLRFAVSDRLAG